MENKYNFLEEVKNTAYEATKKYFEPLVKHPKTIIGARLILAGIATMYETSINNTEIQNNIGLEKAVETRILK